MDSVKHLFGALLIAVAIYLLGYLPDVPVLFLWAAFFIISGVYLGATQSLPEHASGWRYLWKGVGHLPADLGRAGPAGRVRRQSRRVPVRCRCPRFPSGVMPGASGPGGGTPVRPGQQPGRPRKPAGGRQSRGQTGDPGLLRRLVHRLPAHGKSHLRRPAGARGIAPPLRDTCRST